MSLGFARALRAAATGSALVCLTVVPAAAAESPSVLLIYADPRLLPAVVTMDQTLRDTINSRPPPAARFYTEYLDLSWFPGAQEKDIRRAMREKYVRSKFAVVVACGESALRFALRERAALFPGVPVVFCTVEDDALERLRLPPGVTGVTMFRDWAAGLELILKLHPDTRRIVFVGGAGALERGWEALARKAFAPYEQRVTFTYLGGLPIAKIVAAVGALDQGSVIVFNAFLRDGEGRPFTTPEALTLVAAAARVPIYGSGETQLGHGIVGGALVSYEAQARGAGELAVRVLNGEDLGPRDVVRRLPVASMFDARQLDRWGIAEARLPPGSIVKFREPSLWSMYKWHALATLAVIGAQSLLVVGLLVERRHRRRARERLDERLRFETLLADMATTLVDVPAGELDGRIERGLALIVQDLGVDRAGLAQFTGGFDALRVTHARARDGIIAPPPVFTREAWPWSLDRLAGGRAVCFSRLADLPPHAAADRRSFLALGTKSIALIPLIGHGGILGALACSMVRHEREWPEDFVQRLRLLADTFALVLLRRRADSAIEESESRFHLMADAAPVMIWVTDPDGGCIDVNQSWLRFTGRMLGEELGDGWLDGVHPDDRDACETAYRAALTERQPFTLEYRLRRADHAYRSMLDSGVPRFDTDNTFRGYVGCIVDVTDVKAARDTVVETVALRSAVFGSLYGQVVAVDRAGVIVAANESWTHASQHNGGDPRTTGVGADYLQACRRASSTGDPTAQAALEAIDGVLAARTPRALFEYACPGPDGERWYVMIVEPFRRPEGGLVISHIDVTRRRRAEAQVQREREELAHALRVATLGELATSLAHEINQPLAAIASNAQAAHRLLGSAAIDAEIPEILRDIEADAQRAAQIIRRLRVLFKKEHSERQPVDMGAVIKEVLGLLRKELERRRIELDVSLQSSLPRVVGDIVQLQQVVLNVLVNAAEAMSEEGGARPLRVEAAPGDPGIIALTIRDAGVGVEASELERMFERFRTTKRDGLGMGLSISRSIIEAHGGRIWATQNAERGLSIHIELPALDPSPEIKVS